jgi:preprotein translocase subunit YajC
MTDTSLIPLVASAAAAAAPTGGAAFLVGILPWVLIFLIFYLLMIRPQQRRVKQHQAMIAAVKKGDEVITAGGIRARVTRVVDEREIEAEIAQGVKVRIVKSTLGQVIDPAAAKPAND